MARKDTRRVLAPLGEWYDDLLKVDAWITGNSEPQQGKSLLCSKLQERESKVKERLEALARKRGITGEELRIQILKGTVEPISSEEIEEN